jgi:Thioesterase-like superfamily
MPATFYEQDGDRFVPTELTRGPWDRNSQHGGPPAALLGRAIERLDDGEEFQLGRITYEILRPVPLTALSVRAEVLRPGRRVQMVEASLRAGEREVIRARGWRLRRQRLDLPAPDRGDPLPRPGAGEEGDFPPTGEKLGYHVAMDLRFIRGRFAEPGPATVWMRMRQPLLAGEEPSPLQRLLVAADSGNGVSAALDWTRFIFINVDLTVQLERLPEGEWIGLDAVTLPQPTGVGTAEAVLHDEGGRVGRALQTLLVSPRG